VHDAASWPDNIEYATIVGTASDTAEDDEGGKIVFNVFAGGQAGTAASTNLLSIGGEVKDGAVCEVVVNDAGIDCDFRIEGDSETHLIFAEAANDRVSIGASVDSPAATLEVTNASDGGVPLIQLNSNDTDKTALDINANNIDASVVDITANAVTTAAALNIDANALTTGAGLVVASTSTQTGAASALVAIKSNGNRGHASNRHSGLFIDYDSTAGAAAAALYIDSEQTTGIVVDVDATEVTTGTGHRLSLGNVTTGAGLVIDHNDSQTGDEVNPTTLHIDYDKSGVAADETEQRPTAVKIDMSDAATNHAGSEVTMTGLDVNVDSANTQGTTINTGIDISVTDAASNYGLVIAAEDGAGSDIQIKSTADGGDYCTIATIADGETTITTSEAGGGATAHFNHVIDGNISSSANNGAGTYKVQATTFDIDAGSFGVNVGGGTVATGSLGVNAHYDPTSLKVSTGGGDVVLFGADTANTMAANRLVYLNTSGEWIGADADAVGSSGGVLLGICLGADPSDGVLLRGFHHLSSVQGSFAKGAACYVSEAIGEIDFTAPAAPGAVVRVVGFGTSVANVIYFNPSNDWIEL
jgi:hypothetical protein